MTARRRLGFDGESLFAKLERGPVTLSQKSYHREPGSWPTLGSFAMKGLILLVAAGFFIVLPTLSYREYQSGNDVTSLLYGSATGLALCIAVMIWIAHQYLRGTTTAFGETITLTQDGVLRETTRGRSLFIPYGRVRRIERTGSGSIIHGWFGRRIELSGVYESAEETVEIIRLAQVLTRQTRKNWPGICEAARRGLQAHSFEFPFGANIFLEPLRELKSFSSGAVLLILLIMMIIPFVSWWGGQHDVLTERSFATLVEILSMNLAYGISALFVLLVLRILYLVPGFLRHDLPQAQHKGVVVLLSTDGLSVTPRNGEPTSMSWAQLRQASIEERQTACRFVHDASDRVLDVPWHLRKAALLFSLVNWGRHTDPPFSCEQKK